MIDRVLEMSDERIVALKNVTINEPFFQGHFPEPHKSIMPGTLITEGMAQTAAILSSSRSEGTGFGYLTGVDDARFRKQVVPGDTLIYEGKIIRFRSSLCKAKMTAKVDDEKAAGATILLALGE